MVIKNQINPMFRYILIILIIPLLIICSCSSGGSGDYIKEAPDSLTNQEDEPLEIESATMENIVQNIASPVEMAALIKSLGVPYSKDYLSSTKDVDSYASAKTKALNLGVYGADLGYINMYGKTGSVLDYISAIKSLADDINVGQFFDFQTLKRLSSNSQNIDSLMYISVNSFNKMDNYLREHKRGDLSALMVTGVWIEGLYLGTQVAKDNPSEKLSQTIGEQKTILNQLMLILGNYKNDAFIKDIIDDIKKIKHEFDGVKISVEMGEPESVVKDGKLTIVQHEKSTVHMTDEQLTAIIETAKDVRNKLVSLR